jgi:hypothetical protein
MLNLKYKYVRFEVFTAVTMKNASSWMLQRLAFVRIDFSEERSSSIIRVTRIGELGTTLAVTNNRRTLRRDIAHIISSQRPSVASYG